MSSPSGVDPYAVLGVAPDTPFSEVRAVHRRLLRELHPDVNPNARERFDAVQSAFEILRTIYGQQKQGSPSTTLTEQQPPSGRVREASAPQQAGPAPAKAPPPPEPSSAGPEPQPSAWERFRMAAPGAVPAPATQQPRPEPAQMPAEIEAEATRPPSSGRIRHDQHETARPVWDGPPILDLSVTYGRERMVLQPRAQMLYALLDLGLAQDVSSGTQPLNLSLVLDHSSSMQRDDKLQRLKEAVSRIIDMMDSRDYLSIVTFGDRASILLPSTPLGNKRMAKEALDSIRCRGGTEISTGIRAGMQELQTHSASLISQMLVLTDGQTYGDEDICLALASQAGDRQVQITALGLGDDWNSALLDDMAARTGGYSDYVQTPEQLSRVFEEQLRTLQLTAVRNLRLSVQTGISSRVLRATWVAPGIKALSIPTEPLPNGQALELDLGRISMDRDYKILLELVVASRIIGPMDIADLTFTYDVPSQGREQEVVRQHLETEFVERGNNEPPVQQRVHDALRKITAHRLQEQAMQAIQEGQTQKGTASLRTAAKHLEEAGSPDLANLALTEADRIERQGQAQAGNMKRIMYGTRRLG